jgi:hypothetical protein
MRVYTIWFTGAALGAEMEHHLGYAKHEQNTQDIDIIPFSKIKDINMVK